jgi:ABC-type nitrate/sulfonate/bicarbonate transport system ATPase subunit
VLVLDETFAHVSADYEPRLAEFLAELVARTGVQIIMVTHSDAYSEHADVRYRFALQQAVTTVTAL